MARQAPQSEARVSGGQRANETPGSAVRPSRTQGLNDIPPALMLRANETHQTAMRPEWTQDPDQIASEFFDRALQAAGITTAEVAFVFQVSESVVRRMRSKDARERVSFGQLLRLPLQFHIELNKLLDQRFGFGLAACRRVFSDLGIVASSMGL